MRKLILATICTLPLAAAEFKGWISDSSCGVGNASGKAENRDCTESCLKNGAKAVLVTDGDQKVLKLDGGDVNSHTRHKVKITGELKGDTLKVAKIEKAD
ncbi:MAG: hypothetical protein U0Q16_22395 [Bryobacteraceae bacterium]